LKDIFGETLDVLRDAVAMHGLCGERLEHHHFEGAGEEIAFGWRHAYGVEGLRDRHSMS
jgi:hypothetical protein